jgi:hypothetical protein
MPNKTSEGVALLFTIIALLAFVYIAFLGTEYMVEGNHLTAIALSLLFVVVLAYSIRTMCKSKASRNKRSGMPREIGSIVITSAFLGLGSIPFNHFLYVLDHQKEVKESIMSISQSVSDIDSLYADYAESRIRSYKQLLYKEHYPSKKVKAMTNSLKRRLLPQDMDSVRTDRRQWLGTLKESSVWNISTPRNLHYIIEAGEDWAKQYATLSKTIYKGEKAEPFSTEANAEAAAVLKQLSTPKPHANKRGIGATLLCCALVLTTYLHIRRPKSKFAGSHR